MTEKQPKADAVVLLSGGVDSSTALAWAVRKQGWRAAAISFDYGQRHEIELKAAQRVAEAIGVVEHRTVEVNLRAIGGSALTDERIAVPRRGPIPKHIPPTYVPARNIVFLALAAGYAETLGCTRLVIGANIVDYSGYPDCRPEFLQAFAKALTAGTKVGAEGGHWRIEAPLLQMGKEEIIALGLELGLDYALTHSCYDPDEEGHPCGQCDSCFFRIRAFAKLGHTDPLLACFRAPELLQKGEDGHIKIRYHEVRRAIRLAPEETLARCFVCGSTAIGVFLGSTPDETWKAVQRKGTPYTVYERVPPMIGKLRYYCTNCGACYL